MSPFQILRSPNQRLELTFTLDAEGIPVIGVRLRERPMLLPSRLAPARSGLRVERVEERSHEGSWTPLYGERAVIADRYCEATVRLRGESDRQDTITLRCYDVGMAWRCESGESGGPWDEGAILRFPEGTEGYGEDPAEGGFQRRLLRRLPTPCALPLTLVYPHGFCACLAEAGNSGWPRLRTSPEAGGLRLAAAGSSDGPAPWRVLIVAERPAELARGSDVVLNLSPPSTLGDTPWIRPGTVLRDDAPADAEARARIELAAALGLEHVEFAADAVASAPGTRGYPLRELVALATPRGVGVWVSAHGSILETGLDELLEHCSAAGVAGLRLNVTGATFPRRADWLQALARRTAELRLMVAVQGVRPVFGVGRSLPNVLLQGGEGAGDGLPTADCGCLLPFTLGAVGGCRGLGNGHPQTTKAHQRALAVVLHRPLRYCDAATGLELAERVPTVWDESVVVSGEIGEHAAVARRSGTTWHAGVVTDAEAREPTLRLAFLDPERRYRVTLHRDPQRNEGDARLAAVTERGLVDTRSRLRLALASHGGCALRFDAVG